MKPRISAVAIGLILVIVHSTVALGQAASTTEKDTAKSYPLDEIVITGTRTYKKIIDVPYSIQRIDQNEYKYDRKVSVSDVLGSVPGLFLQSRYGNHDVRISIRGFGSRSNSGIRGVRILLDDIPESEPDGQTRIEAIDFQSIGSIEIVKGNSSSLYTNAPGGVINFINDMSFRRTFATSFNEAGSFGLRRNGFKLGIRNQNSAFLATYSYHSARGFRNHSEDYWHILNTVYESTPEEDTKFNVYGYFVKGLIRLPGSLTKAQFDADPFQPNPRDISRDSKRISNKGRIGLRYNTLFGEEKLNELEFTLYGTIKNFDRTAKDYRIINRYGLGAAGRYVRHLEIAGLKNEFSVGGDLFYQTGPIESYQNINGKKGDNLGGLTDETIANSGFYFQNSLGVIKDKLDLLLTGRYDKVLFDNKNQLLEAKNDTRRFEDFTPKVSLNFKINPSLAVYTSYGRSFDSPAGNELDNYPLSTKPTSILNPDLKPQKSKNFEIGTKGTVSRWGSAFFPMMRFEATYFQSVIDDEIVPFEVFGQVFFRNSAKTKRNGVELGVMLDVYGGLKLKSAYTFSNFKYDAYVAQTIEIDTSGVVTKERSFAGNLVPSIPKHNVSLDLSYDQMLSASVMGFVKVSYTHVSGMFTSDANNAKTEGYNIVNSLLGCDVVMGKANLMFSIGASNIFNRTYVAFVNINSTTGEFYEAGDPRHYFGSLRLGYTP